MPFGGGHERGRRCRAASRRVRGADRARPGRAGPAGQPRHRLPYRHAAAGSARARRPRRCSTARGYTLGHFPQSYELATIGGYAATRSAGQASTGYGRSDELVVGLTVATPAGTLRLGRAPRSAAGPDLRQLMLGSEGAFGVITDVTMAVRPIPPHKRYEAWFFPSFSAGLEALRRLEQHKLAPEVSRLSDEDETMGNLALSGHGGGLSGAYLKARRVKAMAIFGWEGEQDLVERAPQARVEARAGGRRRRASARGRARPGSQAGSPRRTCAMTCSMPACWSRRSRRRRPGRSFRWSARPCGRPSPPLWAPHPGVLVGCHVSHLYPAGASLYFTVLAPAAVRDPLGQWDAAKRAAERGDRGLRRHDHPPSRGGH